MNPGDRIAVEEQFYFTCPFCGGDITYGMGEGKIITSHTLPACQEFTGMDYVDFIYACVAKVSEAN